MTEPALQPPAPAELQDDGYEPPTAVVAGSIRSLTQDGFPSDFRPPPGV